MAFYAFLSRTTNRLRSRPVPGQHALSSARPSRVPCGLPASQGTLRGMGDRATGPSPLSRRSHRRRRRWTRPPGSRDASSRRFVSRRHRRGYITPAFECAASCNPGGDMAAAVRSHHLHVRTRRGSRSSFERHRHLRAWMWRSERCRPRSSIVRACARRGSPVLPRSRRER